MFPMRCSSHKITRIRLTGGDEASDLLTRSSVCGNCVRWLYCIPVLALSTEEAGRVLPAKDTPLDERILSWLTFALIAAVLVVGIIAILRFWEARLNLSDEDIALERRMSALNEDQAHRRRDDEIIRLLSGDEQRTIDEDNRR
jgi:hypothetical protein